MPSIRTLYRRRAAGLPEDLVLQRGRRRREPTTEIGRAVEDSGLSTSEIARRLGWTRTRLQGWISGTRQPPVGAVQAIRALTP